MICTVTPIFPATVFDIVKFYFIVKFVVWILLVVALLVYICKDKILNALRIMGIM